MVVVPGTAVHEAVQADGQRIKSFRGSGRSLDDDQRRFLRAQQETLLHEDLADVAGGDTERVVILILQADDLFAVEPAEGAGAVVVPRTDVQKLIGGQNRRDHGLRRGVIYPYVFHRQALGDVAVESPDGLGIGADIGATGILVFDFGDFFIAEIFGRDIQNIRFDPHVGIPAHQDHFPAFLRQASAYLQNPVVRLEPVPMRRHGSFQMVDGNAENAAVIVERHTFDQIAPGPELVDDSTDFPAVGAPVVGLRFETVQLFQYHFGNYYGVLAEREQGVGRMQQDIRIEHIGFTQNNPPLLRPGQAILLK